MNWKTPITMVLLLGILLGAVYYGWSTVLTPDESRAEGDETAKGKNACEKAQRFRKGDLVRARDIRVNVYNAGLTPGLAAETLDTLASKGFGVGEATNAPGGLAASNVTIVANSPKSPEVELVQTQFTGPVRITQGDLARGVDVLVGDGFRAVDEAARTKLTVRRDTKTCVRRG